MNNFLENGTVLPYGLLSHDPADFAKGFQKSFNNTALRLGVIVESYDVSDVKNVTKLSTEYDVVVFEQDANRGVALITYKNCLSTDALGSIADFFEKNFRVQTRKSTAGGEENTKGQDGAVVLVLCLDGTTGKGVILGGLRHPDRTSTLPNSDPHLEGEYNGVHVKVDTDGSTSLVFKGATDNDGKAIDSSQGNTTVKIETDGSFQIDHKTITFRLAKNGDVTLTATQNENVTIGGNVNLKVTGDVNVQCTNAKVNTSANAEVTAGGECHITSSGKTTIKAPEIDLNQGISGITTENSHQGVIDLITGVPVEPSQTVKADV
jgi:hypothetical protein